MSVANVAGLEANQKQASLDVGVSIVDQAKFMFRWQLRLVGKRCGTIDKVAY